MPDRIISIAKDFSRYPGPRYRHDGDFSGEQFRDEMLGPALENAKLNGNHVVVLLDDVAGYGSSFLEEAFGGLVRAGFRPNDIQSHLKIVAETPRFQHHRERAIKYIEDEIRRSGAASPSGRLEGAKSLAQAH